tara:strand:+ start:17585 stop:17998 length:414 start_codon:yes stop_codon:yes gene_type:complete
MVYLEDTNYHKILRIASVVCAVVLVFESGLISESTSNISQGTHAYLANAVGMSVGVKPTELNQYTAALTEKERELEAREAALQEREIAVDLGRSGTAANETVVYLLASILFILLVLIILNYVLDYLRSKELAESQTV